MVQISPDEFWRLTFAETLIKIRGYYLNNDIRSSEFRRLALYTRNRPGVKQIQNPEKLWKLEIDNAFKKELTHEELVERNTRIRNN